MMAGHHHSTTAARPPLPPHHQQNTHTGTSHTSSRVARVARSSTHRASPFAFAGCRTASPCASLGIKGRRDACTGRVAHRQNRNLKRRDGDVHDGSRAFCCFGRGVFFVGGRDVLCTSAAFTRRPSRSSCSPPWSWQEAALWWTPSRCANTAYSWPPSHRRARLLPRSFRLREGRRYS